MASQTVRFEYDRERNILFVEDDFDITTPEQADRFVAIYREQFERIGRPVHVVARIDGLFIGEQVSGYYGERSRPLSQRWKLNFARYGSTATGRMGVKAMAHKAEFDAAVYRTREEAVAAVLSGGA
ncbi:MAG: hypothetical protein MUF78_04635 [Candidatus Edwardsbacteria bacterium]|jgi:hypothetical protein|nr:hypothetical protein [Candidatus Edwardsbacteria bacterium]